MKIKLFENFDDGSELIEYFQELEDDYGFQIRKSRSSFEYIRNAVPAIDNNRIVLTISPGNWLNDEGHIDISDHLSTIFSLIERVDKFKFVSLILYTHFGTSNHIKNIDDISKFLKRNISIKKVGIYFDPPLD